MLKSLHLQKDPAVYLFIREGAAAAVSSFTSYCSIGAELNFNEKKKPSHICLQTSNNDRLGHRAVMSALAVIGFSQEEIKAIYQILASILLLVAPDTDSPWKQASRSSLLP